MALSFAWVKTWDGSLNWAETWHDDGVATVAPTITTASLPDGAAGVAYSAQLAATGTTPITWTKTAGTAGILVSSSGLVTIASPTPQNYSITVQASNGTAPDATKTFSVLVANEGVGGDLPVVTTVTLVPSSASIEVGATTDLTVTVEDQNGDGIAGLTGTITAGSAVTVTQLAPTATDGTATLRVTAASAGSATVKATFDGVASNGCAVTTNDPAAPPAVGFKRWLLMTRFGVAA